MSFYQKKNFAASTLGSGISDSATSVALATGGGAKFPATGTFPCVIWDASYASPDLDSTAEIVLVTARTSDTLTVTRAAESTIAKAWDSGDKIALTITSGMLGQYDDALTAIYNSAVSGSDTNSVTIPDLNILPGEVYKLYAQVKNNLTSGADLKFYQGSDSDSNYRCTHIERGQSDFATNNGSYSSVGYITEGVSEGYASNFIEATICLHISGRLQVVARKVAIRSDNDVYNDDFRAFSRTATVSSVTSITLSTGSTNVLGVGSKFTLIKVI